MTEIIVGTTITVILTVSGFLVKFLYMTPVREFRKVKGNIAGDLEFYANVYCNPGSTALEERRKDSDALRRLATDLTACIQQLPNRTLLRRLFDLPSHEDIREASSSLIALSNGLGQAPDGSTFQLVEANERSAEIVRRYLRIK